jgi:hypothetical protein
VGNKADRDVFGDGPCASAYTASCGGREKGTSHLAYAFVFKCLRIDRGKVWRPYSFPV